MYSVRHGHMTLIGKVPRSDKRTHVWTRVRTFEYERRVLEPYDEFFRNRTLKRHF